MQLRTRGAKTKLLGFALGVRSENLQSQRPFLELSERGRDGFGLLMSIHLDKEQVFVWMVDQRK